MKLSKKNSKRKLKANSKKKNKFLFGGGNNFTISSYNILASGNTHYNWRCHRNMELSEDDLDIGSLTREEFSEHDPKDLPKFVMVDGLLEKTSKDLESREQTMKRYLIVTNNILSINSDIVCLQECEEDFFGELNPLRGELLTSYQRFDNLDEIREKKPEKVSGGGVSMLVHKQANLNKIGEIFSTQFDIYGGSSKGAVILPIEDKSGRPCWVISIHVNSDGSMRKKLVEDIDEFLETQSHPFNLDSSQVPTTFVLGDFNMEGSGATKVLPRPRLDFMNMEFNYDVIESETLEALKDKFRTSGRIQSVTSNWYSRETLIDHGLYTGLDGLFTQEKNIDHIFVYPRNAYELKVTMLEEVNSDGSKISGLGPYQESDKLNERIGGRARINQMTPEILAKYFERQTKLNLPYGPSEVVRGSDHKLITLHVSSQ